MSVNGLDLPLSSLAADHQCGSGSSPKIRSRRSQDGQLFRYPLVSRRLRSSDRHPAGGTARKALKGNGRLALVVVAAQGAPREGLTSALQIARPFRHEDVLDQLSKRGESTPTLQLELASRHAGTNRRGVGRADGGGGVS